MALNKQADSRIVSQSAEVDAPDGQRCGSLALYLLSLLAVFFATFLPAATSAQTVERFNKKYAPIGFAASAPVQDSDSMYYASLGFVNSQGYSAYKLTKFNTSGAVLDTLAISDTDKYNHSYFSNVIIGDYLYSLSRNLTYDSVTNLPIEFVQITKITTMPLSIVWRKAVLLDSSSTHGNIGLKAAKDNKHLFIYGRKADSLFAQATDAYLAKIDTSGSLLWQRAYAVSQQPKKQLVSDVVERPNGDIVMMTARFKTNLGLYPSDSCSMFIRVADSNGIEKAVGPYIEHNTASSVCGRFAAHYVPGKGEQYVYAAVVDSIRNHFTKDINYVFAVGIDTNWTVTWRRNFKEELIYWPWALNDVAVTEEGNMLLIGTGMVDSIADYLRAWGMLLDTAGNPKWIHHYFPSVAHHNVYFAIPTLDGGFLYSGEAYSSGTTPQSAWLLKVDSNGCYDTLFCYPLSSSEVVYASQGQALAVYPNPSSSTIHIKNTEPRSIKMLYNSVGQLILSTKENEIDVSRLAKGVYYLRCAEQSVKVVVE